MLNFLYGVLATWLICSFLYTNFWGEDNLATLILDLPMMFLQVIMEIICFPFIWFYCVFLRHTLHPVSFKVLEVKKIVADSTRIWGNLYFCYDKKARALRNKIFFFKVDPTFSNPNKPSSPPIDPDAWMKDL